MGCDVGRGRSDRGALSASSSLFSSQAVRKRAAVASASANIASHAETENAFAAQKRQAARTASGQDALSESRKPVTRLALGDISNNGAQTKEVVTKQAVPTTRPVTRRAQAALSQPGPVATEAGSATAPAAPRVASRAPRPARAIPKKPQTVFGELNFRAEDVLLVNSYLLGPSVFSAVPEAAGALAEFEARNGLPVELEEPTFTTAACGVSDFDEPSMLVQLESVAVDMPIVEIDMEL
eukprot:TRINITY_DN12767_c0_g1_i1.p2 TRINITY_DN12767_c0_g1~~TRINITY_DN12767_c0_g1_i1.p2  ORF type:complete len:239 (-),score=37.84 TRINITY_DN12767_c0_g1_i1:6-722(-)